MRFNYKMNGAMIKIFFLLLFSTQILAQVDAPSASNNDLRSNNLIFSLKDKAREWKLESSVAGQYHLVEMKGKKIIKVWKVDPKSAEELDTDFADKFLAIKYEMKVSKNKKCKAGFNLSMRGELEKVCDEEKEKMSLLNDFMKRLKKQFT
ncbi:MAG: hypothetical protein VYA54_07510 [Bdellovibrionota bacterium]|nr:hypothetical protein [Bdellovibrionota bacterium]